MQTASKGTYKGMLHCAGGILKNEGPLAFYKVRLIMSRVRLMLRCLPRVRRHVRHKCGGVLTAVAGNFDPAPRYRCLRLHPVWRNGVLKTILRISE